MNYDVGMNIVGIIARNKSTKPSKTKFLFHRDFNTDDTIQNRTLILYYYYFFFQFKKF